MKAFDKFLVGCALGIVLITNDFSISPVPPSIGAGRICVLADRRKATPTEKIVLDSQDVADFAKSRVMKDKDGTPAFRNYDVRQDLTNEQKVWRDMVAKMPPDKVPEIAIKKGTRITVKSYKPQSVDEAKAIIKGYASEGEE